ncbi:MAG: glycosyltransferase N-terminal domain-containing protein [Desulfosoma sp.]
MVQGERGFWKSRFFVDEPPEPVPGGPRVWFHAASVGEVNGTLGVFRRLRASCPHATLFLSVGTPQGYRFARSHVPDGVHVFAAPVDVPWAVCRTVSRLRPDLFVGLESEFWPVLHWCLAKHRIPVVLLNGRVSERSVRHYGRLSFIFGHVFRAIQWASVKTVEDAQRLEALGVPAHRIAVMGSAKYDTLVDRAQASLIEGWRRRLGIPEGTPVVVAGSLRGAECRTLLEIFQNLKQDHSDLVGLFAPRHLDRVPQMLEWLERHHVPHDVLSSFLSTTPQVRRSDYLVVDCIGHLFELYGLGDLIFCGGTLVPVGGHNIVEPVAWGKRVYYGPYTDKVFEEHRVLSRYGVGVMVPSAEALSHRWHAALAAGRLSESVEAAAREAMAELAGVADRQVAGLRRFLDGSGPWEKVAHRP